MKVWALIRKKQKIIEDVVLDFAITPSMQIEDWQPIIGELASALHLSRPILLKKHHEQLLRFSTTAFLPGDFMEAVSFDKFEVEILREKEKKQ